MARLNFARREIELKIVYYGPAFSGKTTNVESLHRLLPAEIRGELHTLRTDQDRTIFFDYVPVDVGEIAGMKARVKLFTVPGQTFYRETRRVVLQGADGAVFVADSDPARRQANLESFADLEENLQAHGIDIAHFPMVVQLNKRDHPAALPPADMGAELNPFGVPVVEAVARTGAGVIDTLRHIAELAGTQVRDKVAGQPSPATVTAIDRRDAESDQSVVEEQLRRISAVRVREQAHVERMQAAGVAPAEDPDAFLSSTARPAPNAPAAPAVVPSAPSPSASASPTRVGAAGAALIAGSAGVLVGLALGWYLALAIHR
jgi:signal recognition particle receptor subunit beta